MRYFKLSDFDCQETGNNEMSDVFLWRLDELRHVCGFPFIITSGYRDKTHSIEAAKKILELMPKVLPVTSRLTTEQKPLPSLRKHQRWDLLV